MLGLATELCEGYASRRQQLMRIVLAAASVLAIFVSGDVVGQTFDVPNDAMLPTLRRGETLSSTKYVLPTTIRRGEIVVFVPPPNGMVHDVKRVVGIGGDRIQLTNGQLFVNDVPVPRTRLASNRWRETVFGISYEVLTSETGGFLGTTQIYNVPPGYFFVLGDNREKSTDSRVLSRVGYVHFENILGRADGR
jgi:signal peptidase I